MHCIKATQLITSLFFVVLVVLLKVSDAQFSVGRPTLPALLAIVRFQNTACQNEHQDAGTCLAEAECSRRAGQSIGTCANGFASCCSFKVSIFAYI